MAITNKGTKWEYKNSLYIVWAFVPFFNWAAFYQIAFQARKPQWLWYFAAHGAIVMAMITLVGRVDENISYFLTFVWLFALPVGVAQAIRLRKEALIRMEAIEPVALREREMRKREVQLLFSGQHPEQLKLKRERQMAKREAQIDFGDHPKAAFPQEATTEVPIAAPIAPISAPSFAARKVDINRASETEIAALAGLGPVLAKRAIDDREQRGPFTSIDAFGERLNIQPHIVERLRKVAVAEAVVETPASQQGAGRVVDY